MERAISPVLAPPPSALYLRLNPSRWRRRIHPLRGRPLPLRPRCTALPRLPSHRSPRRWAPPPRLLLAVYHPRNRYVLHLSADASNAERRDLATWVAAATPAVGAFRNVAVVGAPTAGTPIGSSGLTGTLRAAAVLLRLHPDWDWFITLNAADYPVITQDVTIHGYKMMQLICAA
ncbi:hypothetical protein E2562_004956 [Oryza meyeriana var. granulata]|uniref:Uncharacterized protein n=1 Tax=Oryza meyeriana var. granulata TaxID=110450 RepID=A0A6G1C486_9ORYZ|nr:hypothetical protein E2562_004956 [Oryza meyeriana var. granulata]